MKTKRIIGFILTLSLIISCAVGLSTTNGNAMQVSAIAPTTPTVGVASILSGYTRIYCNTSGYIDAVYVNGNNVRFNFVSSAVDLSKTHVILYKESSFKSFIYTSPVVPTVSVVNSNGTLCNSVNLPEAGRYQMAIYGVDSNNQTVCSQNINLIYMDYNTNNYFVNDAWNFPSISEDYRVLYVHAKIHDLGNLGMNKSDVQIKFYRDDNPANYFMAPSTSYTLQPYRQSGNYDTDYDFYLFCAVSIDYFGSQPGIYGAEIFVNGVSWKKAYALVN